MSESESCYIVTYSTVQHQYRLVTVHCYERDMIPNHQIDARDEDIKMDIM